MKPTWLIERGVYGEYAIAFKAEVERQGMDCFEVDYRPGKQPPGDIVGCGNRAEDACVVVWGTLPLVRQVQLHHAWVPGGWCNLENLDYGTYSNYFGPFLLNGRHALLPGAEAAGVQEQLFGQYGANDEIFVRPSGVSKLFPGKVIYKDNFPEAIAASRYDPAMQVVVAQPKEIGREWRLVIASDEIVAASQYRDCGAINIVPDCPTQISEYVGDVLRRVPWRPDSLFVMDVCESDDRLYVLELNCFSCSGFYECDAGAIVRTASEVAEKEWGQRFGTNS
jgi:hypothetical protein